MGYIQIRCPGERREFIEIVFLLLCHWFVFNQNLFSILFLEFPPVLKQNICAYIHTDTHTHTPTVLSIRDLHTNC